MSFWAPAATIDDAHYIDFIESLKLFSMRKLEQHVRAIYLHKEKEFEKRNGRKPATYQEVEELVGQSPVNRTREFLDRWTQDQMWDRIRHTYESQADKLIEELEDYQSKGPGSIELDPEIELPDYYAGQDFHLMPGNYDYDDLMGYVFDYGVKVFFFGVNDDGKTQRLLIQKAAKLVNRKIERAMDIGCAIGQDTLPIKEVCPDAEVFGLDLAAPMLKFAHKRAVERGVDVKFVQRLAEDTKFPDGHFDLIFSMQLFHELDIPAMNAIMKEGRRILRPGGVFVIADIPRTVNITPYRRWLREWQVHNNNEPYMTTYTDSDIPQMLKNTGFQNVREDMAYEPVPGGLFQIYFQIGER